ncbi:FHA domain-containing protein [Longispora sp. K20-0274]|uniref:FHA domain-containing protein n=1 Tax=Longispora sp. K20-0274 TaxID=3088255 RepID=UPI00399C4220
MRFEISKVLDAIERRLSTDPALVGALVDVGEVLRAVDLDGGRPTYLPRLGAVVDALAVKQDDAAVPVYAIAEKALLSSLELTSNEKMVLRRWADDGQIEVVAADPARRLVELAGITGLPVLTRHPLPVAMTMAPVPGLGGVALIDRPGTAGPSQAGVLSRRWRCPDGEPVGVPTLLTTGQPTCPRHGLGLVDEGPRPVSQAVTVWVGGTARTRFAVDALRPVVVGRSPAQGVMLGPWLDDDALQWISRAHVELTLAGNLLTVTDKSTNGTVVVRANGPRVELSRDQSELVGEADTVELHQGVELTHAGRRPSRAVSAGGGIMAEAPTIALRLPIRE